MHYYTGDCTTPEARSQIQRQFIEILNTSAVNMICRDAVYRDKCKAENVKVTCSLVEADVNRKRRDAGYFFFLSVVVLLLRLFVCLFVGMFVH